MSTWYCVDKYGYAIKAEDFDGAVELAKFRNKAFSDRAPHSTAMMASPVSVPGADSMVELSKMASTMHDKVREVVRSAYFAGEQVPASDRELNHTAIREVLHMAFCLSHDLKLYANCGPAQLGESAAISALVALAHATWTAAEDSEEMEGPDGRVHSLGGYDFDAVSDALDALDSLPELPGNEGMVMNGPMKAEAILRPLMAATKTEEGDSNEHH